jgi:hypothetical protein
MYLLRDIQLNYIKNSYNSKVKENPILKQTKEKLSNLILLNGQRF